MWAQLPSSLVYRALHFPNATLGNQGIEQVPTLHYIIHNFITLSCCPLIVFVIFFLNCVTLSYHVFLPTTESRVFFSCIKISASSHQPVNLITELLYHRPLSPIPLSHMLCQSPTGFPVPISTTVVSAQVDIGLI